MSLPIKHGGSFHSYVSLPTRYFSWPRNWGHSHPPLQPSWCVRCCSSASWSQPGPEPLGIHQPSWPRCSMYRIYANIGGILMVNVTIYSIHGSYGWWIHQRMMETNSSIEWIWLNNKLVDFVYPKSSQSLCPWHFFLQPSLGFWQC